jgi:hypothetical protein
VHSRSCSLLARMADALSMVKEGDKTMFDNSVMLYTSDNGEQHHAGHEPGPSCCSWRRPASCPRTAPARAATKGMLGPIEELMS